MASSSLLSQGRLSEKIFENFRGLNRRSDRLNTNDSFYYDLLNGYCKKDLNSQLGFIVQREGSTKLNSVALDTSTFGSVHSIKTIFEAKWNSGGLDVIIRAGTAWGKFNGTDTFTGLDTGRADDVIGQCAMFQNQLIMVDGGIPRKSTAAYAVSNLSEVTNGTVTMTIATPAVFTFVAHGFVAGQAVKFTTTGALPTGLVSGTTYYVISTGLVADAFQVSSTLGGPAVNTSGSQSGTHTLYSFDANMPQDSTAVWVHRDKVWLNSTAAPMKAYFSKTNSANTGVAWTGTNDAGYIDLSTILPEGDTIRGYRTIGGTDSGLIAIICDKYTVVFEAGANVYTFNFLQYFPTTCISINACDYIGTDLVYPSRNSFTSLAHSSGTNDISTGTLSDLIEPYWRGLVSDLSETKNMQGCYDKTLGLFYILFPIANNYQILVYSVDIKNFVGRYTYPFNVYSFKYLLNGTMLMGSDDYVYTMNSGTSDSGSAISWSFKMPGLYFGTASRNKKPIEYEALLKSTTTMTLYLDYYFALNISPASLLTIPIDLSGTSVQWDSSLWDFSYWDQSGNVIFKTSDLLGRGRLMFVELRHATLNANISFPWFLFRYVIEGIN